MVAAPDLYGSHTKIRRDHSDFVVVVVGHLAVACNWDSATPASLTTRQGGKYMKDVVEFASTMGDLAVASYGPERDSVRLGGIRMG